MLIHAKIDMIEHEHNSNASMTCKLLSLRVLVGLLVILGEHEQYEHAAEHGHGDAHGRGERVREHRRIVGVAAVHCAPIESLDVTARVGQRSRRRRRGLGSGVVVTLCGE